jgi:hypothetical protein
LKQKSKAKQYLEKATKDYTGYQLETVVHFRSHCGLQAIKNEKIRAKSTVCSGIQEMGNNKNENNNSKRKNSWFL